MSVISPEYFAKLKAEVQAEIAQLKEAVISAARTAERACDRLVMWEPVIKAAKNWQSWPQSTAAREALDTAITNLLKAEKARPQS